jgi:ribonuclease P protein component
MRRDQRVRSAKDFQIIFKRGKHQKGALINIWVYGGETESVPGRVARPKFGILVSKKVDTRAPRRNLWKRRIREACRLSQNRIQRGVTVLIQARPSEKTASFSAIKDELNRLLDKAGVLIK